MTKYSLKNICLGIGIGLIIASMVNISTAPKKLTKDQIIREAEQYNLIVMDAKDMIKKEQPATEPLLPEGQTKVKELTIVVEPGAASDGIAEKLMYNKLISSKQEFLSKLKELDMESRIQIGSFKIPMGSSVEEIIEIITKSPN